MTLGGLPNKKMKMRAARDARRAHSSVDRKQKDGEIKYRASKDPHEALCRKALAVYQGTGGDADVEEVLDNLIEITQEFGGVVLGEGTCRQDVLVGGT